MERPDTPAKIYLHGNALNLTVMQEDGTMVGALPVCWSATMRSIQELIERYPDEWLAIDVKGEEEGRPKAGKLVYHTRDRDEVWQKTKRRKRLYIVFAGPPLKKGYTAAF